MNRLFYHLGNLLIILSLSGFSFVFYPIARIYLFPPTIQPIQTQKGIFLTIPKIHAQAPIVENVNPWNESQYRQALKKGIAHAKGTALPDEKGLPASQAGTIFLFAHSSGAPWEIAWYNTIFLRLGELQKGDSIEITKNGKKYLFKVRGKKEVWPSEVNYLSRSNRDLSQPKKDQLILQTCTPIGTSLKRLLIFADPVDMRVFNK